MSATTEAAAGRPFRSLDLPDAEVLFCPDFFSAADADRLLRELLATTAWRQEVFRMGRKETGGLSSSWWAARRIATRSAVRLD
jgi:hypothetical protein